MAHRRRRKLTSGTHPASKPPEILQSQDTTALGVTTGDSAPVLIKKSKDDPFSEESLRMFFSAVKSSAAEHHRPREPVWDICWALYNNEYDWSTKAWWQHKTPISKVRTSVDRAVGLFRKTLMRTSPFYGIQAESRLGRTKG